MFQTKDVEKIKHTFCTQDFFFLLKSCRLWNNVEKNIAEPDRPQMTMWRVLIACWTQVYNRTLRIRNTFPRQQWLRESALMLHYTYSVLWKCDFWG